MDSNGFRINSVMTFKMNNPSNAIAWFIAILGIYAGQILASEATNESYRYSLYGENARGWMLVSNLLDKPISGIVMLRESGSDSWNIETKQVSLLLVEHLVIVRDNMRHLASCEQLFGLITNPELQEKGRKEMLAQCTTMLANIKEACRLCDESVKLAPDLKLNISSSREQLDKLLKWTVFRGDEFAKEKTPDAAAKSPSPER